MLFVFKTIFLRFSEIFLHALHAVYFFVSLSLGRTFFVIRVRPVVTFVVFRGGDATFIVKERRLVVSDAMSKGRRHSGERSTLFKSKGEGVSF